MLVIYMYRIQGCTDNQLAECLPAAKLVVRWNNHFDVAINFTRYYIHYLHLFLKDYNFLHIIKRFGCKVDLSCDCTHECDVLSSIVGLSGAL